ncbi:MAG: SMC-Scp complex subunit ScpB [Longimicrobiales bacterium]
MTDAQIVEAILFASDAPLKPGEIARGDESLDEDRVEAALASLRADYDESSRAFELTEVADGVQLMTRSEFAPYLERFDTVPRPSRLSGPALEALAIVAYRQPISRIEVEYVRGVNSSGVIRTLLDHEMVMVVGRGEGVGRPVLYGTTSRFLEHFGLPSIDALPRPEELPVILRDRAPLDPLDEGEGDLEPEEQLPIELAVDDAVAVIVSGVNSEQLSENAGNGGLDEIEEAEEPVATEVQDLQSPPSEGSWVAEA